MIMIYVPISYITELSGNIPMFAKIAIQGFFFSQNLTFIILSLKKNAVFP